MLDAALPARAPMMDQSKLEHKGRDRRTLSRRRAVALSALAIVAAGVLVYAGSFAGSFVFDDGKHILLNPAIRRLWPPWHLLTGRRPVVNLTLAVNYAIGADRVWGYHAVNLAVHVLAALTLFGIVRRTLLWNHFGDRLRRSAPWLALTVALFWIAHPLQTQSVTYIIQRGESLMGLFYLLTLYCVMRGADARPAWPWYVAATCACALGMGSKAVMITAPVVVLLYDYAFLAGSFTATLRRRWGLYLSLLATWSVLAATGILRGVLNPANTTARVGFGFKDISPLEYALTQPGVILHYLTLCFWPQPLCIDHGWPVARTAGAVVPQLMLILALLIPASWTLARHAPIGFVGLSFFLILAPTSSVVPVVDPLFEHRMYLPLAAIVAPAVIGGYVALCSALERMRCPNPIRRALSPLLVGMVVVLLGYATHRRNGDYRSSIALWRDVTIKRPDNARAHNNLGDALSRVGRPRDAAVQFRRAIEINPLYANAYCNLGAVLLTLEQTDQAVTALQEALRIDPNHANAHRNLGVAYARKGLLAKAVHECREAVRIRPGFVEAHYNLGVALGRLGRTDEAVDAFRHLIRIQPRHAEAHYQLGRMLVRLGRSPEAAAEYRQTLRLDPGHAGARRALKQIPGRPQTPGGR